jgi:hypothetical protein
VRQVGLLGVQHSVPAQPGQQQHEPGDRQLTDRPNKSGGDECEGADVGDVAPAAASDIGTFTVFSSPRVGIWTVTRSAVAQRPVVSPDGPADLVSGRRANTWRPLRLGPPTTVRGANPRHTVPPCVIHGA